MLREHSSAEGIDLAEGGLEAGGVPAGAALRVGLDSGVAQATYIIKHYASFVQPSN